MGVSGGGVSRGQPGWAAVLEQRLCGRVEDYPERADVHAFWVRLSAGERARLVGADEALVLRMVEDTRCACPCSVCVRRKARRQEVVRNCYECFGLDVEEAVQNHAGTGSSSLGSSTLSYPIPWLFRARTRTRTPTRTRTRTCTPTATDTASTGSSDLELVGGPTLARLPPSVELRRAAANAGKDHTRFENEHDLPLAPMIDWDEPGAVWSGYLVRIEGAWHAPPPPLCVRWLTWVGE